MNANGSWTGGNPISTNAGVFAVAGTGTNPTLTNNLALQSLTFAGTGVSGWTVSGPSTLTLSAATGAISGSNTSGTNTISSNLTFTNAAPTILQATGGALVLSGNLTGTNVSFGGIGGGGTVALTGSNSFQTFKFGNPTAGNGATYQFGNNYAMTGSGTWTAANPQTFQAINQDVNLLGLTNTLQTAASSFSGTQSLTIGGTYSLNGTATAGKTVNSNIIGSKTLAFNAVDIGSTVGLQSVAFTLSGSGNTSFLGSIFQTSTNAQSITITNTGTTRFQGVVATTGAFSQTGAGTVILSGTMSGPSGYTISNASANFEQTSTGVISGTGGFSLSSGNATLSGSNSYLGTTQVSNGVLKLNSANALPSSGALTIGSDGVLGLGSDNSTFTRASGTGAGQVNWGGGGFAAYGSDATVNFGNLGVSGTVSAKNFTVWSASTADRTVEFLNPYYIGTGPTKVVTVNNGSADVDARFSGGLTGTLSNISAFTKAGAGTLELTAASPYSGTTTIAAGQLRFSGTGSLTGNTGPVVVNGSDAQLKWNSSVALTRPLTVTQGTISGTGSISATGGVSIGTNAVLSPGNSPGTQAFTTGLTLAPGGTYVWEVNSGTGTTGTNWDLINVTGGGLNLASLSGAGQFNLDLSTLTASGSSGSMDNYTLGGSYTWRIFDANALTLPGLFGSSPYTPGTDITSLFNVLTANWKNTVPAANDISVKVAENGTGIDLVVVPEPGTIALGVIGIGLAGFATWRRRRR